MVQLISDGHLVRLYVTEHQKRNLKCEKSLFDAHVSVHHFVRVSPEVCFFGSCVDLNSRIWCIPFLLRSEPPCVRQGVPKGRMKSWVIVLAAGPRVPRGGVTRQGVVLINFQSLADRQ